MLFVSSWFVMPIAMYLLILGLGTLINGDSELELPYFLASGFALMIAIGQFTTMFGATAKLTMPLLVAMAIIGLVAKSSSIRRILDNSLHNLMMFGTYLIAGLPVLIKGKVSWPGWVQLDDTATFMAITNRIMSAGQTVPKIIASTYDRVIQVVIGGSFYGTYSAETNKFKFSYPVGSLIPLGTIGKALRIDFAWIYFPYLAFCIALTAGLFYVILQSLFGDKRIAIASSIAAAMASTFYAYALWGGIKEVALVPVLLYSLISLDKLKNYFTDRELNREAAINYSISALAIYAIGGKSGIGFIMGEIAIMAILFFARKSSRDFWMRISLPSVVAVAVIFLTKKYWTDLLNKYLIPEIPDSGNLSRPLNFLQVLGIWPSGDFRGDLYWRPFTYLVLAIAAVLVLAGLYFAIQYEMYVIPVGLITTFVIAIYSSAYNGVWLTGKAISISSPFFIAAAILGVVKVATIPNYQKFATSALVVVLLGVGTSNALAFRHTWLAPSEKVQELDSIGKMFVGQGPTLMTDYSTFGSRYFLRNVGAESASELRVNTIPLRDGSLLPKGFSADIDLFDNKEISKYLYLVLKHTAVGSRPLFNYDLLYEGKYYDVWERNNFGDRKIVSLGLGNNYVPAQVPSCDVVSQFASQTAGTIYAAVRKPTYIVNLAQGGITGGLEVNQNRFGALDIKGGGKVTTTFNLGSDEKYQLFTGGSYGGQISISIDGNRVYSGSGMLDGNAFLSNYLTTVELTAGNHSLELSYSKPFWIPGAGEGEAIGPIFLTSETAAESQVLNVAASDSKQLCGKNLDWLALEKSAFVPQSKQNSKTSSGNLGIIKK